MPDITMCCNYNCPLKDKCYRYRAVPSDMWQSFALFKPESTGVCEHFWEIDILADRILPTEIANNRYERDSKWRGLLEKGDNNDTNQNEND